MARMSSTNPVSTLRDGKVREDQMYFAKLLKDLDIKLE